MNQGSRPMLHRVAFVGMIVAALLGTAASAASAAGTTERVSVGSAEQQGNGESYIFNNQVLSGNGRYAVFNSAATNFGAPEPRRLYLRDRVAGTTAAVDLAPNGQPFKQATLSARLSRNGRVVAFQIGRGDFLEAPGSRIYVRDLATGRTRLVSINQARLQYPGGPVDAISADGRYVLFSSITFDLAGRENRELVLRDVSKGSSTSIVKNQDYASMSADARYIVYATRAKYNSFDPLRIIRLDRRTGAKVRLNSVRDRAGDRGSFEPVISDDGNIVAFSSDAISLVPGDSNGQQDIFVRNVATGATERVSVGLGGTQSNGRSEVPSISADGRYVAFSSDATNLVAGDTNVETDAFVFDRQTKTTVRVDVSNAGAQGDGVGFTAAISADGSTVAFQSDATNLVPNDTNGARDVFVRVLGR